MTVRKALPRMASAKTLCKFAIDGIGHKDWYRTEAIKLKQCADEIGVPFSRYVDIMAITSPKVHVSKNKKLTDQYVKTGSVDGIMKATRAALTHYEKTGEIRGPKTSKFAAALKGDDSAIVLDLWMSRAFGIDQSEFSRPAVRKECEKRMLKVCKELHIKPAECQAAIWFGVIISYGYKVEKKVF